ADQHVADAADVEALAVVGRRRAHPLAVAAGVRGDGDRPLPPDAPQLLAGGPVQRPDDLVLLVLGLGDEDAVAGHDGAGVARPQLDAPDLPEGVAVELVGPGGTVDVPVPVGPAPL